MNHKYIYKKLHVIYNGGAGSVGGGMNGSVLEGYISYRHTHSVVDCLHLACTKFTRAPAV